MTMPGCKETCGNTSIPYPFGLDDPECFRDQAFRLVCNTSFDPPMLSFPEDNIPILDISLLQGEATALIWVAKNCNDSSSNSPPDGFRTLGQEMKDSGVTVQINLTEGFKFSNTRNKFTAIGCNMEAFMSDYVNPNGFQSGCSSVCGNITNVINGSCSGIGCCQTSIPRGLDTFQVKLQSNSSDGSNCSYAFLVKDEWFSFMESDIWDFIGRVPYKFGNQTGTPVVLEWAIGNQTCGDTSLQVNYACRNNTECINSTSGSGYLCHCKNGYHGNPYLPQGCQDIDECKNATHDCEGSCENTLGSYKCICPEGTVGDGYNYKVNGTGCTPISKSNKSSKVLHITLGTGLGLLFVVIGSSWVHLVLQKRKESKTREKFFKQNGGLLLHQLLVSREQSLETMKIFTSEELKKATNNYDESRILGRGGYGTVYKGVLQDNRIVAIKKSKIIDKDQIEQFINEVLILSQVNHRNVVKLLGCCLETEVPLLVYEFISNGTLFHHIHTENKELQLSWKDRLRIAAETAGALAYLHSAASPPIIHRDVKSANILLDGNHTAKVSDFGASRLVPQDQMQLTTLVQGTLGYLDPEYLYTSQLTEKSDVYSFGVVLVELLTGRKALSFEKPEEERNLAMHFVSSMRRNRLFDILDDRVMHEGSRAQLQEVAELAKKCLKLNGEERPTMKEVAMELVGLQTVGMHPWVNQYPTETEHFLSEYEDSSYNGTTEFDSLNSYGFN